MVEVLKRTVSKRRLPHKTLEERATFCKSYDQLEKKVTLRACGNENDYTMKLDDFEAHKLLGFLANVLGYTLSEKEG